MDRLLHSEEKYPWPSLALQRVEGISTFGEDGPGLVDNDDFLASVPGHSRVEVNGTRTVGPSMAN